MQQSPAEAELNHLADLCSSLHLTSNAGNVGEYLLEPIASVLGAESAAYRHLSLRKGRPHILELTSIGVSNSVADDYLSHFHQFDPFLESLCGSLDIQNRMQAVPSQESSMYSYFHEFLKPNGLVHHAGFLLRDRNARQAWIFNFHRPASCPEFASLELARARLIETCLQGQASNASMVSIGNPFPRDLTTLTTREYEVVQAIAGGFSNKHIAARLDISPRTVENHLRNIYEKLNIHTRTQLLSLLHQ